MAERPPIVFFGSGPVAAKSLELLATHCDIEAVITKPQPPHHSETFPVLVAAEKIGAKVYTPVGKAELSELFTSKPVTSHLGIVIDYGFIIGQDVIDYFPLGIINSHFSLLPEWRGADPITFAILSGQQETGVSLMLITAGMDEGPILAHAPFDITEGMTTPELTDELITLSDWTLQDILPRYIRGSVAARPQEIAALPHHTAITYSRKLTKEDGVLDLAKSAVQLEREIRAFIEWPKSRTSIGDKEVIVTAAHVAGNEVNMHASQLPFPTADKKIGLPTTDGVLVIDRLKPAGKQEMTAEAFLAGYKI